MILQDCLLTSIQKLELEPDWMLQQDNDPKYIAKVTRAWFKENNIKVMKKKIIRYESNRKIFGNYRKSVFVKDIPVETCQAQVRN